MNKNATPVMARVTMTAGLLRMLGTKQYKDPTVTTVRELIQNALDACKRKNVEPDIRVYVISARQGREGGGWIVVKDNGIGMTPQQIQDDLLHAGGHAGDYDWNDDTDQIGGFGIAKLILFMNRNFVVHTLDWVAFPGTNELIEIWPSSRHVDGTIVAVQLDKDITSGDLYDILCLLATTNVSVSFVSSTLLDYATFCPIGGDQNLPKLTQPQDKNGWCIRMAKAIQIVGETKDEVGAYTDIDGYAAVRVNGLTQFGMKAPEETVAIIDLEVNCRPKDDDYPLTVSREGLKGNLQWTIESHLRTMMQNRISTKAKIEEECRVIIPDSWLVEGAPTVPFNQKLEVQSEFHQSLVTVLDRDQAERLPQIESMTLEQALTYCRVVDQFAYRHNGDASPAHYMDEYEETGTERIVGFRVMKAWTKILKYVETKPFIPGLSGKDWLVGQRNQYGAPFPIYLVNPDKAMDGPKTPKGRILALWHLACHEVSHAKHSSHTEDFASQEGQESRQSADMIARILDDEELNTWLAF